MSAETLALGIPAWAASGNRHPAPIHLPGRTTPISRPISPVRT